MSPEHLKGARDSSSARPAGALARQRRFVTPGPDETVEELAHRAMPDAPLEAAVDQIKSWNLHVFAMRRPPGLMLGSDVIFVEPPIANG